ncbi:MAG: hypothetical protein IRY84_18145 [Thermobispora bispora]|nr:hypothetical protein [Thermobispora bispora]
MYLYDDGRFDMPRGPVELCSATRVAPMLSLNVALARRGRARHLPCRAYAVAGHVEAAEVVTVADAPDAVAVNRFPRRDLGKDAKAIRAIRPRVAGLPFTPRRGRYMEPRAQRCPHRSAGHRDRNGTGVRW